MCTNARAFRPSASTLLSNGLGDEIHAKITRYIALKSYRNLKIDGRLLPFAIANFYPYDFWS